jgi:signal peptidase I
MRSVIGCVSAVTVVGLALAWARRRWLIVTVDGVSMSPTLTPGDRLLARRAPPAVIRTGDIVVAERPAGSMWTTDPQATVRRWMIKRAVAVPGDPVPRTRIPALAHDGHGAVPRGMYVLLGDNLADSFDSRIFGYVPATRILGVVAG